ncbi:MAG: hypothetical protein JST54_15875 [Deltaproteobacteria bacterium]|nr:hypothetical protein [Deltaproteobacteria bacterium]
MQRRRQVALGALTFGAAALIVQSGMPGLPDSDPYRHMAYATELLRSGFALRGHPFLPLTLLGDSGVDLWWGYHLLLVPFTPLGVIWGARAAGVVGAAAVGGFVSWFLARWGQRRAAFFAMLALAMSPTFVLRDACARPTHLTVPLLLVSLAAGTGELAWGWAALSAALHLWLHLSAPLAPVFAGLGWLASLSAGRRDWPKAVAASVAGLLVALLVRPDRAHFLRVAALHNLGAMGFLSGGLLPHAGAELEPIRVDQLVGEIGLGVAVLVLALVLARGRAATGPVVVRRAILGAVLLTLGMTLRSGRFLDYLAPLLAVAAGLSWPSKLESAVRTRVRAISVVVAVAGLLGFSRGVDRAWEVGRRYLPAPASVAEFAERVRVNVPAGTLLFTDDIFLTAVLYASLPEYRYLNAYDPALLYVPHPDLFWVWHHAVVDAAYCDQRTCAGQEPSAAALRQALARLGTTWVVTSYPPGVFSMQSVLLQHPPGFELVAYVPADEAGLFLWRVVDAAPGPPPGP